MICKVLIYTLTKYKFFVMLYNRIGGECMSNKKPKQNENQPIKQKLTLPWLIISIASMLTFFAFVVAMFYGKYEAELFATFVLVIAAGVFLDGLHKKKQNYISGNINFFMVILCILCAVMIVAINR